MNENKRGFRAKKHKVATIEPSKPRNFVAKNAAKGGAGAHKDKKKAMKQGDVKHKKDYAEHLESMLATALTESRQINETGLDPIRRMKAIQFIVQKTGWERNYVELASDEELMDLYVKVKKGLPVNDEQTTDEGSDLDSMDVDQLQGYYSDFHKDLIGFRPRSATPEQWNDPEWLKKEINGLHDYFDRLKSSPEGRAQLKADGWHIDDETNEGSKVDRQAMHITKSMMKRHGMSRDEAEAAAWAHIKHPKKKKKVRKESVDEARAATASFRAGNKKRAQLNAMSADERKAYDQSQQEKQRKRDDARLERERQKTKEGWTHDSLAAQLFEQELTYEDKLSAMLNKKLK